jgi:hypothetical protein
MTGRHTDGLTVEAIEAAREALDLPMEDNPDVAVVTTRQARTVFLVPGPVIRIMRHEAMMWRGQWLKVSD